MMSASGRFRSVGKRICPRDGAASGARTLDDRSAGARLLLDRLLAALALVVAALPMGFVALLVRAKLGSPVFFMQERAGLGGASFRILKFRTMRDLRDASGAPLPDEMRITRTGRLIRRSRLDELPQILAILRGDMALVGPRPLLPETIRGHGALGAERCSVRPGLTGWAQVNGNTRLTEREKLSLDIWYVDHRSFALDMRILVATALTIVFGERVDARHLARAKAHLTTRAGGDRI